MTWLITDSTGSMSEATEQMPVTKEHFRAALDILRKDRGLPRLSSIEFNRIWALGMMEQYRERGMKGVLYAKSQP